MAAKRRQPVSPQPPSRCCPRLRWQRCSTSIQKPSLSGPKRASSAPSAPRRPPQLPEGRDSRHPQQQRPDRPRPARRVARQNRAVRQRGTPRPLPRVPAPHPLSSCLACLACCEDFLHAIKGGSRRSPPRPRPARRRAASPGRPPRRAGRQEPRSQYRCPKGASPTPVSRVPSLLVKFPPGLMLNALAHGPGWPSHTNTGSGREPCPSSDRSHN
jgi:hypothetical protein